MTYEQRSEMFAKDYLSVSDIMALLDLSYNDAAKVIREIRRTTDRLHIQGKIHVQDYIDYYGLDIARYQSQMSNTTNQNKEV